MELPPEIALQSGHAFYRAGDHELMCDIFVGDVHPPTGDNADAVFTTTTVIPGETAAGPVSETGCKMVHPA
jgi:branched-chain amino acid transport system substrate-binding protein